MASAANPKAKREFDRHDGTGRAHNDPKHGAGKGNWGTLGDELTEVQDHAVLDSLQQEAELDAASPDVVREADAPTDDKLMTLDEYEEQQRLRAQS